MRIFFSKLLIEHNLWWLDHNHDNQHGRIDFGSYNLGRFINVNIHLDHHFGRINDHNHFGRLWRVFFDLHLDHHIRRIERYDFNHHDFFGRFEHVNEHFNQLVNFGRQLVKLFDLRRRHASS